jgi:hypothetical protein
MRDVSEDIVYSIPHHYSHPGAGMTTIRASQDPSPHKVGKELPRYLLTRGGGPTFKPTGVQ